jgi:isopenicillin N synthase-like dioxygenase
MSEYFHALDNLAGLLSKVVAIALAQPHDYFDGYFSANKHPRIVRLNYYPVCEGEKQVLGVNPHQGIPKIHLNLCYV